MAIFLLGITFLWLAAIQSIGVAIVVIALVIIVVKLPDIHQEWLAIRPKAEKDARKMLLLELRCTDLSKDRLIDDSAVAKWIIDVETHTIFGIPIWYVVSTTQYDNFAVWNESLSMFVVEQTDQQLRISPFFRSIQYRHSIQALDANKMAQHPITLDASRLDELNYRKTTLPADHADFVTAKLIMDTDSSGSVAT